MPNLCRSAVLVLLSLAAAVAQDDRDPGGHVPTVLRTGQTLTDLTVMKQTGLRPTDIEVESTSPLRLTVTAVSNAPSYGFDKNWWFYSGLTSAQVGTELGRNRARLIDLESWDDNGTTRHAALMVPNTGADARTWWWYVDVTPLQVNSYVNTNQARLVDLERYSKNGSTRFSCVMVANGGRGGRAFRHFYDATMATIHAWNAANGMRIYDLERISQDRFDAIVVEASGEAWWSYQGVSEARVQTLMNTNLGRVIDVERRPLFGGLVQYDVVMLDNARNDLERRVRDRLTGTDGITGAWLKSVGGGIVAKINEGQRFDPGAAMLVLHRAHGLAAVDRGAATLRDALPWAIGRTGSCPTGSGPTNTNSLESALRRMIFDPNTRIGLAVEQRFVAPTLQQTAAAFGMSATRLNHRVGCIGVSPNETTLLDLTGMYERVALGHFQQASLDAEFFNGFHSDRRFFPTWGSVSLDDRIRIYGAALGLSLGSVQRFNAALEIEHLAGSYDPGGRFDHCETGLLRVTFLDASGNPAPREYVFGAFDVEGSDRDASRTAVSEAAHEMVWDRVRAALDTWTVIPTITVRSSSPGPAVLVRAQPSDLNGSTQGWTGFDLEYLPGTTVTLIAPPTRDCDTFRRWVIDGTPRFVGLGQVSFQVTGDHTAVAEYRVVQPGTVQQLGAGCPGRSGRNPVQTVEHGNGTCGPQQGQPTTYRLADTIPGTTGVLHIGSDTNRYGSIALPWDLSPLGATGCLLHHDVIVSAAVQVDLQGEASLTFTWPVDPAARGVDFHTTFAILDFAANPMGLVHSNALSTAQGGAL